MIEYKSLDSGQRAELLKELMVEYNSCKAMGLKLDMSRGKPGGDVLDLAMPLLDTINSSSNCYDDYNNDCRNYGLLDGIPQAKELFAQILQVDPSEVIVGGNSSLNLMYDTISRAFTHGVYEGSMPWSKQQKIKFICPVPGYDRHFSICQYFCIEMIPVPMLEDGPDMDKVEELVADPSVKGIWTVPKYSNPQGITYSDSVVERMAALKPAADDFRIFWDNAYAVHHLGGQKDKLKDILSSCKKAGNPDMVFIFCSTSKISFPGSGVAAMASSRTNIEYIKKQMFYQTIGHNKLNQLRHVRYFKDIDGINAHMDKIAELLSPRFELVFDYLDRELKNLAIASYKKPRGGYFISFDGLKGTAKRIHQLCKEAGLILTPAGATYPYGLDPSDSNIRLAPTYPCLEELDVAMQVFCLCVKIASLEALNKEG